MPCCPSLGDITASGLLYQGGGYLPVCRLRVQEDLLRLVLRGLGGRNSLVDCRSPVLPRARATTLLVHPLEAAVEVHIVPLPGSLSLLRIPLRFVGGLELRVRGLLLVLGQDNLALHERLMLLGGGVPQHSLNWLLCFVQARRVDGVARVQLIAVYLNH